MTFCHSNLDEIVYYIYLETAIYTRVLNVEYTYTYLKASVQLIERAT